MEEKKIIVQIDESGSVNAETFGIYGVECIEEIDKLMKDIALAGSYHKKSEFYEQKTSITQTIRNKYD